MAGFDPAICFRWRGGSGGLQMPGSSPGVTSSMDCVPSN